VLGTLGSIGPNRLTWDRGLSILMSRGMTVWMQCPATCLAASPDTTHHEAVATATPCTPALAASHREWVLVLAALVMGRSGRPIPVVPCTTSCNELNAEVRHG
jgi:hypothetical protein